jgi:hypothetical protein
MKKQNLGVYAAVIATVLVLGVGLFLNTKSNPPSPITNTVPTPVPVSSTPTTSDTSTDSTAQPDTSGQASSLQSQQNLMALQANCGTWGNVVLKDNHFLDNPYSTTHYNTTLNKCIVEINSSTSYPNTNGDYQNEDDVFDAAAEKLIFSEVSYYTNGVFSQNATDYRSGYAGITDSQFDALKQQYMNN